MQRAEGGIITIKMQRLEQKGPSQWKKFMSHGANKDELTHFFAKNGHLHIIQNGLETTHCTLCINLFA